jgi:hypothetical protein
LSGKKARKVEKALNHARRRALEAAMAKDGEVVMTGEFGLERVTGGFGVPVADWWTADAPKMTKPKNSNVENDGEKMEVDDISWVKEDGRGSHYTGIGLWGTTEWPAGRMRNAG